MIGYTQLSLPLIWSQELSQLRLPLICPQDLYPTNPDLVDILDGNKNSEPCLSSEFYVTFRTGDTTISGKIIGKKKNGIYIVDPGGSGCNLFYASYSDICGIGTHSATY